MGHVAEGRRKPAAQPSTNASTAARFDRVVARVSDVPVWVAVVVLGALLATIWLVVRATGGTKGAWPHLFYIPIVLAALPFRTRGSVATAVVAAVLCWPLLPLDTATGESQPVVAALVRGAMFVAVGWLASASMSVRQRAYQDRVDRDLREMMVGAIGSVRDVDLALVPLIAGVLERHAFHPVFQPIYSLKDGGLLAVEALTRFDAEPARTPDVWFLAAHQADLGVDLEIAAVEAAVEAARELPEEVRLWVNVSPAVVAEPRFLALVTACGQRELGIELTEHAIVADYELLLERIAPLREAGVLVAVDDAGAGFASLRHIVHLAPDVIKLDISLAQNIADSPVRRALGQALIAFVQETGGAFLVEGIEQAADLCEWAALGADSVQGYLVGRPGTLPVPPVSSVVTSLVGVATAGSRRLPTSLPSQRRAR